MNTQPKLAFACPMAWSEMKGSDYSRNCAECGHTIHNLSALNADERTQLLRRARNEKICGTYFMRLSGELVTPQSPLSAGEVRSIRQVGVAALSAGALALAAGCVSTPVEKSPEVSRPPSPQVELDAKSGDDEEIIQLLGFFISGDELNEAAKPKEQK